MMQFISTPPWWLISFILQTLEEMQSLWSIWWNKRSTFSYRLTCFANSTHNKAYLGGGINIHKGHPRWLSGKESTCQCRGCGFYLWDRKIPLEKEMTMHPSISARKVSMDRVSWQATVHGVTKESDMTYWLKQLQKFTESKQISCTA